jgi:hypothetical protein
VVAGKTAFLIAPAEGRQVRRWKSDVFGRIYEGRQMGSGKSGVFEQIYEGPQVRCHPPFVWRESWRGERGWVWLSWVQRGACVGFLGWECGFCGSGSQWVASVGAEWQWDAGGKRGNDECRRMKDERGWVLGCGGHEIEKGRLGRRARGCWWAMWWWLAWSPPQRCFGVPEF